METVLSLLQYYANLLIIQYNGLPNFSSHIQILANLLIFGQLQNTVQTIVLSDVPASGTFTLEGSSGTTGPLAWNSSLAQIEAAVNDVIGYDEIISITGSLSSKNIEITFTNTTSIILMTATSSLENSSSNPVTIAVSGNQDLGPLALQIQNAFDVDSAVGTQLDVLGKYAGVTRTGYGFQGQPITLGDTDFATLIRMATITNNSGSDLYTIQKLLRTYFPGELFVFDYCNMRLSYAINSSVGSENLVELFVTEGLLPKPMGVQLSTIIYSGSLSNYFGLVTYDFPNLFNVSGINTYDSYISDTPMLTYDDGILG